VAELRRSDGQLSAQERLVAHIHDRVDIQ
jgi:hypothetical protein